MKQTFVLKKLPLLLLAAGLVITVAVAQPNSSRQKAPIRDTVPAKERRVRDLDEALDEIDRSEREMELAMREMDREKWQKEMRSAMKEMDKNKAAMKEDLAKAMKELDKAKIQLDVQKALAEVDSEKMKQEVAAALAQVDFEKIKTDLKKWSDTGYEKWRADLDRMKPQVDKAMNEARKGIEMARKELRSYKSLVETLDAEGLLKKEGEYTIEYKKGELSVNGKPVPPGTAKKAAPYLAGKDDFTLRKDGDGLRIGHD